MIRSATRKKARNASLLSVLGSMLMDLDSESEEDELTTLAVMSAYEEDVRKKEEKEKVEGDGGDDQLMDFYSDSEFKRQFRMNKTTFEHLSSLVSPYLLKNAKGRRPIEPKKQLLIAIWMLTNQESFREAATKFGLVKRSAWFCINRTVWALLNLNMDEGIIRWPREEEVKDITEAFRAKSSFPGVIGAVDGCHIPIKAPIVAPASYINRKGFHSVILQAVCDHRMRFTDCHVGEVGSYDDDLVFRRSPLFTNVDLPTFFPNDCHLLGDSAYPLRTHLLTPYRDDGLLSEREHHFNYCLSQSRSFIEIAFALLKGRFQRLKCLDMRRVDKVSEVVLACCVLHNICLDYGDDLDEIPEVVLGPTSNANIDNSEQLQHAIFKRDMIANELFTNKTLM